MRLVLVLSRGNDFLIRSSETKNAFSPLARLPISRSPCKISERKALQGHSCEHDPADKAAARSRCLASVVAGELGEDLFEAGGFGDEACHVDVCGDQRAQEPFAGVQRYFSFG